MNKNTCFSCGEPAELFEGYYVCADCKQKLGLFTDAKIAEHIASFAAKGKSYANEIGERLVLLEKDYTKKKIKLQYLKKQAEAISAS